MGATQSNSAAAHRSQYETAADRWLTVHLPVEAVSHVPPGCSSSSSSTEAGVLASMTASHARPMHCQEVTIQLAPGGGGVRDDSSDKQRPAHLRKTAAVAATAVDAASLKSSGSFASIGGRSHSSYDDDTVPELTAADSGASHGIPVPLPGVYSNRDIIFKDVDNAAAEAQAVGNPPPGVRQLEAVLLSHAPRLLVIDNFFDEALCQGLMELAREKLVRSRVAS
eukprot:gene8115-8309_t